MKKIVMTFLFMLSMNVFAQYAPPVGQDGSAAVAADSSIIIGWGDSVRVQRGPVNIMQPEQGAASHGVPTDGIGHADHVAVSLGDGGMATYSFLSPLSDKEGFDFAVFENSFSDGFLELAFVEVSSDGENFVRFPAVSLTQTQQQVGAFETLEATLLYNLAGKYRGGYGVPFDLEELADSSAVDISAVTHVRIVDVIGVVNPEYATTDSEGNYVNDPFPTAFNSGGFDLDAIAILDESMVGIAEYDQQEPVIVYPNPVSSMAIIEVAGPMQFSMFDDTGMMVSQGWLEAGKNPLHCEKLKSGMYLLIVKTNQKQYRKKVVIR